MFCTLHYGLNPCSPSLRKFWIFLNYFLNSIALFYTMKKKILWDCTASLFCPSLLHSQIEAKTSDWKHRLHWSKHWPNLIIPYHIRLQIFSGFDKHERRFPPEHEHVENKFHLFVWKYGTRFKLVITWLVLVSWGSGVLVVD